MALLGDNAYWYGRTEISNSIITMQYFMGEAWTNLGVVQGSVPAYTATETSNVMHHLKNNYSSDQVSRRSALFHKSYVKHFPNPHTYTRFKYVL